jgi:hypothetical protein
MYYGDVNVLATRADLLGTSYLWIATDQNGHGTWGGSEIDSEECKGGGIVWHDCFEGTLQEALVDGAYWWFDPSRDIGEPEAPRYDAWPLEARGSSEPGYVGPAIVPQIKREPNNPNAAYIENNTGFGVAREYLVYRAGVPAIPAAKRWCGWTCPNRLDDGNCSYQPYLAFETMNCDGGAKTFPSAGGTVDMPGYADLYKVGESYYHAGPIEVDESYQKADFAYQLWGNPNLKPLESGNVANRWRARVSCQRQLREAHRDRGVGVVSASCGP